MDGVLGIFNLTLLTEFNLFCHSQTMSMKNETLK